MTPELKLFSLNHHIWAPLFKFVIWERLNRKNRPIIHRIPPTPTPNPNSHPDGERWGTNDSPPYNPNSFRTSRATSGWFDGRWYLGRCWGWAVRRVWALGLYLEFELEPQPLHYTINQLSQTNPKELALAQIPLMTRPLLSQMKISATASVPWIMK